MPVLPAQLDKYLADEANQYDAPTDDDISGHELNFDGYMLLQETRRKRAEGRREASAKLERLQTGGFTLPKAWTKFDYHEKQQLFWNSTARFNVVPAGRRSGKTAIAKRRLIRAALKAYKYDDSWFIAAAPTHRQAKQIYWRDLKRMVPKEFIVGRPSESELTIRLINGADITVMGLDVPERAEGRSIDGIVLDEYGNMIAKTWPEHIRPALSDRKGWASLIGVPEGRNHYYDTYVDARADESGEWETHTWTSEDILDPEEIKAAQHDLDPLTYEQEYRASFVNFTGLAYYSFDHDTHSKEKQNYSPDDDLILCFDFNVAPGVAVMVQEKPRETTMLDSGILLVKEAWTAAIDEVYIPRGSNTLLVCDRIIDRYQQHRGTITCYGDATGGAGGSAKVSGSDWDLIKKKLKPVFQERLRFRVPAQNPRERVRVNSVNSRLKSIDGRIAFRCDPKCRYLVKDFEGVRTVEGGSGEIDKDADPKLSHISDAVGYYIVFKFPVGGGTTTSHSVYH